MTSEAPQLQRMAIAMINVHRMAFGLEPVLWADLGAASQERWLLAAEAGVNAAFGTPSEDWGQEAVTAATEILNYLGFGTDPSKEPFADRRRDRLSAIIERVRADAALSEEGR